MTGLLLVLAIIGVLAGSLVRSTAMVMLTRRRLPRPDTEERAESMPSGQLARALEAADVALAPAAAVRIGTLGAAVVGLVATLAAGPALGLVSGSAGVFAGPIILLALAGRRDRRADAGLPRVLDDVARSLRSGTAPAGALAEAAGGKGVDAARSDLGRVVGDIDRGAGLLEAMDRWADRRPSRSVRLASTALAIGFATGGTRSQAVESVAATLRERWAVEREARALATQARASAAVIALAPLAFAGLAGMSDPGVGAFLVETPVGLGCLLGGLTLDAVGAWWMHRIVQAT